MTTTTARTTATTTDSSALIELTRGSHRRLIKQLQRDGQHRYVRIVVEGWG